MNIGKYVKSSLPQIADTVLAVNAAILKNFNNYSLENIHGIIETSDAKYSPDNISDLEYIQRRALKNIHTAYLVLKYKSLDQALDISMTHSTNDPYIDITCGGLDISHLEEVLAVLKDNVFKVSYYRHSNSSEFRRRQKEVIMTVSNMLESLDDFQVRSLVEIKNEKNFQDFLYPILRSHFDDLEDEHYLPKYGTKTYKPDFGIPSVKLLIEAKFIKSKADLKRRQSEIHDDIIGYLGSSDKYNKVIIVIYNYNNIAINSTEIKSLEKARGVERIIICNHVIPNNLEGK